MDYLPLSPVFWEINGDTCFLLRTPCSSSFRLEVPRARSKNLEAFPRVLALTCVVWWRLYSISSPIGFQHGGGAPCVLSPDNSTLPCFLFPNRVPSYKRFSGNCTHSGPIYHMPSAWYNTETRASSRSPLISLLHHLWKSGYNSIGLVNNQNQGSVWPPRMFSFAYSVLASVPIVRSFVSFDNS